MEKEVFGQLYKDLDTIKDTVEELYERLPLDKDVKVYKVQKLAANLESLSKSFADKIDELDENMNLKTTKLPDLSELFKDDPVSLVVEANRDIVLGDTSQEATDKLTEAVEALKCTDRYCEEVECSKAPCKAEDPNCCMNQVICEFPYCGCDIKCVESVDAIHKLITSFEDEVKAETDEYKHHIRELYEEQTVYDEQDLEILRFYLKDEADSVDEMTDQEVIELFKQLTI